MIPALPKPPWVGPSSFAGRRGKWLLLRCKASSPQQLYLKSKSPSLWFAHLWLRELKHLISRPLVTRGQPRMEGSSGVRPGHTPIPHP